MAKEVALMLTGGYVVTVDEGLSIYPDGAVAVDGADIVAVGPAEALAGEYSAAETVDCSGQVIMPGLVNAHTHVPMTLLRGLNDDLRLDV